MSKDRVLNITQNDCNKIVEMANLQSCAVDCYESVLLDNYII